MVCLHGFTDTWRSWELVLPELEQHHDVLAPTLAGHTGGPAIDGELTDALVADAVERAMDEAGVDTAHIVGNSLGGYLALQLAERGRARTVVALAPAGGWAEDDPGFEDTLDYFRTMQELLEAAVPHAEQIVSTPEGRRRATEFIATNFEHIPAELIVHQMRGAVSCEGFLPMIDFAIREGWHLDAEKINCPVRMVWGTADRILEWPTAAVRFRDEWSRTPIGWSSKGSATALSSTSRPRPRSSSSGSRRTEAERVGFEPTRQLSPPTRFPVAHLKPLGHLSGAEQA
jgi:pimeloyl-ACP methyl ester carboxylesterase